MNEEYFIIEIRTAYGYFPEQECWDTDYSTKNLKEAYSHAEKLITEGNFVRIRKITKSLILISGRVKS